MEISTKEVRASVTVTEPQELKYAGIEQPRRMEMIRPAKAEELDRMIRKLSATRDGLRHAAARPAFSHMQCSRFRRFLRAAASGVMRARTKRVPQVART
jgi:hypothetical protein